MFLGGCQIQNDLAQPYESLDVSSCIEDAFKNHDLITSSWVQDCWWELFEDEQLSDLMNQMFQNNPTLSEAIERVSIARNVAKQRLSPLLPSVDAQFEELFAGFSWNSRGISDNWQAVPDSIIPKWINFLGYVLNFKWTVDLWGKNRYLYKAAIDEVKMQIAEAAQTKLILSTQLAEVYFALQFALNKNGVEEEILKIKQEKLSILVKVYENALADEVELQSLEKDILIFQNSMLSNQKDIELGIHQIKTLIGESACDQTPIKKPIPFFGSAFPFPEKVPIDLLLRRPDIISKIWTLQAQVKKIKSAKVSFLPSIDLGSYSGFLDLSWQNLLNPRGWFSSILPGVTLPLFKGLQLRSNLQYTAKQYNLSVYNYNQALLNAAKEVVDSILVFRISNQQLMKQEEIFQKQRNLLELSSLRYEYGLNSYLDVLDTKIDVLEDEINMGIYNRLHLMAALNLIKSLGGGYQDLEAESKFQEPNNI